MHRRSDTPVAAKDTPIEGGVGASDGTNGGGAGSGSADGDTGMTAEQIVNAGNVDRDKARLFPVEQTESSAPGEAVAPKPMPQNR